MFGFVGALLITYAVSRLLILALPAFRTSVARICLIHAISWVSIAVVVGFLKAFGSTFYWQSSLVYLIPQAIWLAFDLYQRRNRS